MGNDILPKSIINNQIEKLFIDKEGLTFNILKQLLISLEEAAESFKSSAEIKSEFRNIYSMLKSQTPLQEELIQVESEYDIVAARNAGARMARDIGFGNTDAVKIATIISELARNIFLYSGSGKITITPITGLRKGLKVMACDEGPGIKDLDSVMNGTYNSERGMGMGLRGVKNLSDTFEIETKEEEGTTICIRKFLR